MRDMSEQFDASRSKGYLCAATSATLREVLFYAVFFGFFVDFGFFFGVFFGFFLQH